MIKINAVLSTSLFNHLFVVFFQFIPKCYQLFANSLNRCCSLAVSFSYLAPQTDKIWFEGFRMYTIIPPLPQQNNSSHHCTWETQIITRNVQAKNRGGGEIPREMLVPTENWNYRDAFFLKQPFLKTHYFSKENIVKKYYSFPLGSTNYKSCFLTEIWHLKVTPALQCSLVPYYLPSPHFSVLTLVLHCSIWKGTLSAIYFILSSDKQTVW